MDKELRKEVRDWKVEVEARLAALEAALAPQSAVSDTPVSDTGNGKRASSGPSVAEKAEL